MRTLPLLVLAILLVHACSDDGGPAPDGSGGPAPAGSGGAGAGGSGGTGGAGIFGRPCDAACVEPAFCTEDDAGSYCTAACGGSCPGGFSCSEGGPPFAPSYCRRVPGLPGDERTGDPCAKNSECGGTDGLYTFSEPFCEPDALVCTRYCVGACPAGFTCSSDSAVPLPGEATGACVPGGGELPSNPVPADGAALTGIQGTSIVLRWSHGASGAATYDLHFGDVNPPPLAGTGQQKEAAVGGLAPRTTYFWRVVARANGATMEGPVWSFTTGDRFVIVPCPGRPTVRIGDRSYATAEIDGSCWLAENVIPGRRATGSTVYDDGVLEHFCSGDPEVCGLTTWRELNGYTGGAGGQSSVCPAGWRLPTRADWLALVEAYDGDVNELVMGNLGFRLERDDRYQPDSTGRTCTLPGSNPAETVDCTRAGPQQTRDNPVGWYWTAEAASASQQHSAELFFEGGRFQLQIRGTPVEFGLSVRCVAQ